MNERNNERNNEWKWSKGEVYYKSARKIYNINENEKEEKYINDLNNNNNNEININEINNSAIQQSIEGFHFTRNDSLNKREDLDNKISDRELIYQRGTNPYLGNDNYLKDITARDIFLKPKNTTIDN